ncbi:MAG: membrane protein insertion efficiency factor YidD [Thermodesulfobacteriota bacterium]
MAKRPLIFLISLYKTLISPFLPPSCRFYPSCSAYASEAIGSHGAIKGFFLAAVRILKCHPFNPGGVDPVPGPRLPSRRDKRLLF